MSTIEKINEILGSESMSSLIYTQFKVNETPESSGCIIAQVAHNGQLGKWFAFYNGDKYRKGFTYKQDALEYLLEQLEQLDPVDPYPEFTRGGYP